LSKLIVVKLRLRIVKKRIIDNREERAKLTINLKKKVIDNNKKKTKAKIVLRKNKRELVTNTK